MTTIEEHKRVLKELEKDIKEKIRRKIIVERQKLIGFATSEASTNSFAVLLHKKSLISPGFNINHRFFASIERAKEKFAYNFPSKEKILRLLVKQENFRDKLYYGKYKKPELVRNAIKNYFKLKSIIEKELGEDNG